MDNDKKNRSRKREELKIMRLGAILEEAGLISRAQIEVALIDQSSNDHLLLGEILALHGWLKQETADFFAVYWPQLLTEKQKQPMGKYLKEAGLLTEEQIYLILKEQEKTLMRFGALAVIKGYLNKNTIDFFLRYLYPDQRRQSAFLTNYKSGIETELKSEKEGKIILPNTKQLLIPGPIKKELNEATLADYVEGDEPPLIEEYLRENDLIWIA